VSFHITRIVEVADDQDANVERFQAMCIREDCPWSSEPHETRLGAEEAAWSHEQNGDRLSGEHAAITEENQQ
jgi:hypothetical protein